MEKNWYLTWDDVIYTPGTLSAEGYRNGKKLMHREIKTTGPAAGIVLSAEESSLKHGSDAVILHAVIVDKDGQMVPYADNELRFTIEGSGSFLGIGNGNPGSHESDLVPVRRAFNGLCQLLVRPDAEGGNIRITATAEGLGSTECTVLPAPSSF